MKKLFVLILLVAFLTGCRERTIFGLLSLDDIDGVLQNLQLTTIPENSGATITLQGLPDALPTGLTGVAIYVDTFDMSGLPSSALANAMYVDTVAQDTTLAVTTLLNGQGYYVEPRGVVDDTLSTTLGIGGKFYPRPWGQGEYLSFDPNQSVDSAQNSLTFNRTTGTPASSSVATTVDFLCYYSGGNLYFTDALAFGGQDNKVVLASEPSDKWLKVQEAPETYADTVMLEMGKVYHINTSDNYYGKFAVDSVVVSVIDTSVTLWMKYAFQTAHGVKYY